MRLSLEASTKQDLKHLQGAHLQDKHVSGQASPYCDLSQMCLASSQLINKKLLPIINIPLLLSMITLFSTQNEISAYIFLGLIGISNGLANVLGSSTWAEIYGVKYIGSIKALTTALMVFSTAFGTALFGILIDQGFSIENIAFISGAYIVVSLVLLLIFQKSLQPIKL